MLRVLISLALLCFTASCVRVKPYERATHGTKAMQDQSPEETKLDAHVHEYREGAIGGNGVGGGGCGCN